MAVSIDKVYQKVLAFANKEQRGYITPQEFNLFADQAQMEIFEQYFYDINQWRKAPGNDHATSDMLTNLEEKISKFKNNGIILLWLGNGQASLEQDVNGNPIKDLYRISSLFVDGIEFGNKKRLLEEVKGGEEHQLHLDSSLCKPTSSRPIYTRFNTTSSDSTAMDRIMMYPTPKASSVEITMRYIRKPAAPKWGYMVANEKPLYLDTRSVDFELHSSEESELVYRVLAYAGIALEKQNLTQFAASMETAKVQQEKQ